MPLAGRQNHPSQGPVSRRKSAPPNVPPDCIGPFLGLRGARPAAIGAPDACDQPDAHTRCRACGRLAARYRRSADGAALTLPSDLVLRRRSNPDIEVRPTCSADGATLTSRSYRCRCMHADDGSALRNSTPDTTRCVWGTAGARLPLRDAVSPVEHVCRARRCPALVSQIVSACTGDVYRGAMPTKNATEFFMGSAHCACNLSLYTWSGSKDDARGRIRGRTGTVAVHSPTGMACGVPSRIRWHTGRAGRGIRD